MALTKSYLIQQGKRLLLGKATSYGEVSVRPTHAFQLFSQLSEIRLSHHTVARI